MDIPEQRFTRRHVLKLGMVTGCALAFEGCGLSSMSGPGDSFPGIRGFNVHPYGGLLSVQAQALNNVRANWVRITLGITADAAGPYIGGLQANILGLISDFHLTSINRRDWPDMVEAVIRRYPSIQYFQILNEPEVFFGISNEDYVLDYLRPAHDRIRTRFPYVKIVSAAPIGQPSGIGDFTAMSDAGADRYCDFRAVHIYFEQELLSPWSAFRATTNRPIMITETGMRKPEEHLNWWLTRIPEMRRSLRTDYVFYYTLLEQPDSTGFEIITGELDNQGNVIPAPGSELYNYLRG